MLVQPTLNLQFARARFPDPRINFSRPSAATYTNALGQVAPAAAGEMRFDFDPATGQSLGLLIEESRTNHQTYSDTLVSAGWANNRVSVTPVGVIAGLPFHKVIPNTENATHSLNGVASVAVSPGESWTSSFFVKAAEYSTLRIRLATNFGFLDDCVFDALTGDVRAVDVPNATVKKYAEGVWRVSVTATIPEGATALLHQAWVYVDPYTGTFAGDGAKGLLVSGGLLEQGAFPTSHIPTTDAPATRAADVAAIDGEQFGRIFNSDGCTVAGEFTTFAPLDWSANERRHLFNISADNSHAANAVNVFFAGGVLGVVTVRDGVSNTHATSLTVESGRCHKVAVSLTDSGLIASVDGASEAISTPLNLDAFNHLGLGVQTGGVRLLNGHIGSLYAIPRALDAETLKTLTGGAA